MFFGGAPLQRMIKPMQKTNASEMTFLEELRKQRWDDHRLYHHSRINQSLHLLSAISFLISYVLVFVNLGFAVIVGWVIGMWSRQIGHFFFEPKTYDNVNRATHKHKENIKIGYNLFRKRILQSLWAIMPVVLWLKPGLFGLLDPHQNVSEYFNQLALLWILLAVGALVFRTVQIFFIYNVRTGLVWLTKIITDPFNDFKIYLKSPLYLLRGELIDPMIHVRNNEHHTGQGVSEQQSTAVSQQ